MERTMVQAAPRLALVSVIALPLLAAGAYLTGTQAETAHVVPVAVADEPPAAGVTSETAVLAGGCFWGVQGVFQHVDGVTSAISGYTGGKADTAQYETVGSGVTGHAESVRVTFDPRRISYGRILQIYFSVAHDPTELNRQGPDAGTQYRSTIFPMTAEQQGVAKAYIAQLNAAHVFHDPVVTTIEMNRTFYPAEAYHQDYLTRHPDNPYIAYNDLPKIRELQKLFPDRYRDSPVRVAAKQ
jgi:peptide-methionine (S)-S-oxide reductase